MERDDNYLRELMIEAQTDPRSFISMPPATTGNPIDYKRWLHFNLLCDAGFMMQITDSNYRLTNAGYDRLEEIGNDNA